MVPGCAGSPKGGDHDAEFWGWGWTSWSIFCRVGNWGAQLFVRHGGGGGGGGGAGHTAIESQAKLAPEYTMLALPQFQPQVRGIFLTPCPTSYPICPFVCPENRIVGHWWP